MNTHRHDDRILSRTSEWSVFAGILTSIAGLALFLVIAGVVIRQDPWTALDLSSLQWLRSRRSPSGITFFSALTFFGEPVFLAFLGLVFGLLLLRKRQLVLLATWWITLIGGGVVERMLKNWIRRPRPELPEPLLHPLTFSLPSGHAMNSMIAYGMLACIVLTVWKHSRATTIAIVMATALWIAGIGFSRLYLGVHYIGDVVAGFALGFFWLGLCLAATGFLQSRRNSGKDSHA